MQPDWIVWLPGLVLGINLAVKTCCAPNERALSFSPIYPPFLRPRASRGAARGRAAQAQQRAGTEFAIDFEALEAAMRTAGTRLLLLCHPHNPVGRLFTRDELDRLAAFCESTISMCVRTRCMPT